MTVFSSELLTYWINNRFWLKNGDKHKFNITVSTREVNRFSINVDIREVGRNIKTAISYFY